MKFDVLSIWQLNIQSLSNLKIDAQRKSHLKLKAQTAGMRGKLYAIAKNLIANYIEILQLIKYLIKIKDFFFGQRK